MGQPGQGVTAMNFEDKLVINQPKLQTLKQKYAYSLIAFVFWALWLYLLQPIIALMAWLFGFEVFYANMILMGGWEGLSQKLITYLVTLAIMAVVFYGWALYNRYRFQGKIRRGKYWKSNVLTLASEFNVSEEQVLKCQTSKRLELHFDDHGKIIEVDGEAK